MNELRYYFDGNKKLDNDYFVSETYVKGVFQSLFQNTTIPATRTATIQDEIFNAIWGNDPLRRDIWKDDVNFPDDPDADPDTKVQYKSKFATLTNNINNSIYDFIKAK